MLVIGDRELRFRVNARPTSSAVAPQNYGSFHDLSAISPARASRDAGLLNAMSNFAE
jgi:hypothetical protein